ncbi:type III-D CRISPR-associated RAMP protein Csx10 [Adonisia turfae]|uniref:CRISPR-associated RAMP protein Csx10 n=1 Tax=Adonisia turfae CCMR0081 TaxID=2292702 RepID=A0A6M0RTM9_9CYAN|nr:CRISPR-associated RAMP protein Csx10 [Adonisia turfae]NEZ59123.1 CRISPR-associated RAMP protein Csx10 [Adonisia turfae CCMR0081]
MNRIELTITAKSPLAIGRKKPGGSVSEVERYIPGSVLRGAIAGKILSLKGDEPIEDNDDFSQLFTSDKPAIFQNAYSAVAQITADELSVVDAPVWVVPATAVSAKTGGGFLSGDNSGVFDTLIDRFLAENVGYPYEPTDPSADNGNNQVDTVSGFYSYQDKQHFAHTVTTRFLTRVGINRRRAVAEDQILYSPEVINESFLTNRRTQSPHWEPIVFRGSVLVPNKDLANRLIEFINSQSFRLGSSGSRGLGKVTIDAKETSIEQDLDTRLDSFNTAVTSRWQNCWSILSNPDIRSPLTDTEGNNLTFFSVSLQSEAILTEQWRRTTVISPAMLEQLSYAPDNASVKPCGVYSSYGYRSGWNSAWGLMKDQELVTNKGSTYLFSTTASQQEWLEALSHIETNGIGERTAEGYGQVRVCHEFHHQAMREELA